MAGFVKCQADSKGEALECCMQMDASGQVLVGNASDSGFLIAKQGWIMLLQGFEKQLPKLSFFLLQCCMLVGCRC